MGNFTEIFYTICKMNVPSIQYRIGLRWSNLMAEMDSRCVRFINFMFQRLRHGAVQDKVIL
jgi:hypothetical protein